MRSFRLVCLGKTFLTIKKSIPLFSLRKSAMWGTRKRKNMKSMRNNLPNGLVDANGPLMKLYG